MGGRARRRAVGRAPRLVRIRHGEPENVGLVRLGRVAPRVRVARGVRERVALLEDVRRLADAQLERSAQADDELRLRGECVRRLAGGAARRDVRLDRVEAPLGGRRDDEVLAALAADDAALALVAADEPAERGAVRERADRDAERFADPGERGERDGGLVALELAEEAA